MFCDDIRRRETQEACESARPDVEGNGIEERGCELEGVACNDEEEELRPEGLSVVDRQSMRVEVCDENDGEGIDELTHER